MNFISNVPMARIITADRDVVTSLLALNVGNRTLRPTHVKWLETQVQEGNYKLTNQGVGVSRTGRLIDGQHRLEAIERAGYPAVPLLVVYGLDDAAAAAIDNGLNRTIADIMHFAFGNTEATATTLACARFWGVRKFLIKAGRRKPTPHEIAEWYAELSPYMAIAMPLWAGERAPAPVLAAICDALITTESDPRILEFMARVISGVGMQADSAELRLHQYFAKSRGASGGWSFQEERYRKTEFALKAALAGKKVTRLGGFVRSGSAKAACAPHDVVLVN